MPVDLQLLRTLVRIPSATADAAAVSHAVAAMRDWLGQIPGLYVAVENVAGREALWASTTPGRAPDYMMLVHLDVVPAPEHLYDVRSEGNLIFGRGVADCKGNACVAAEVLRRLAGTGVSAGCVFATDEETGGETTAAMAALGYHASRLVVVIDASPWSVANAQKGTAHLLLRAKGRGGHSSAPWELDNPLEKLMDAWARVRAAWPALPEGSHWGDTATPTVLRGGAIANQVPDEARMSVNVRYTRVGGAEAAADLVRRASGLEVEILSDCQPVFCDENDPELARLRSAMQSAFRRDIPFYRMDGATDSRHFVNAGAPIAIIGTDGGAMHADGEWADPASFDAYADMLCAFFAAPRT